MRGPAGSRGRLTAARMPRGHALPRAHMPRRSSKPSLHSMAAGSAAVEPPSKPLARVSSALNSAPTLTRGMARSACGTWSPSTPHTESTLRATVRRESAVGAVAMMSPESQRALLPTPSAHRGVVRTGSLPCPRPVRSSQCSPCRHAAGQLPRRRRRRPQPAQAQARRGQCRVRISSPTACRPRASAWRCAGGRLRSGRGHPEQRARLARRLRPRQHAGNLRAWARGCWPRPVAN